MDTFTALIRIINLVTSVSLLVILLAATVYRWRRMDPVERLFCMGLLALYVYVTASSFNGLSNESPLYWFTPVLTIGNVWLGGGAVVLTIHKGPEVLL